MTKTARQKRISAKHAEWRKHCKSGKEWFASKSDAEVKLVTYQLIGSGEKKPVRAYQCEFCRDWHLTSKPYRRTN